jgi:HD-GYP domain-containing protein (c-di-GMP phosphodiesterase class II)
MALAEAVGFPGPTVTEIGIAALLHDVGKLRVPAEILNSGGRLTDEQAAIVKRHPGEGARLLLATPQIPELAPIVAYEHHIQYDGGGYPSVPRTWKLNLASAITTVADVYDALRSDRPYRPGLEREKIQAIMTMDAGTVFDPTLIRIFFEMVVPRTTIVGAPEQNPRAKDVHASAVGS